MSRYFTQESCVQAELMAERFAVQRPALAQGVEPTSGGGIRAHSIEVARAWASVEGPPDYGWLGLKWFRRKRVLITAYRCPSCGYLEAYARAK